MEDFKFLRHRNCTFVDCEKTEDAIAAVDSLNSKFEGDEELRADFGRSQPPKPEAGGRPGPATPHEEWGGVNPRDNQDHSDHFRSLAEPHGSHSDARQSERRSFCGRFRGPSDVYQAGSRPGTVAVASGKIREEKEEPSDVLWVGFPLLSKVDEDGLRRAFVPYGEVERVKTFPGRTYAFVQFKHVDEASRAKVALEGKLFNDPRVHIRYSNSEVGPVDTPRVDGNSFLLSHGNDVTGFSEKQIERVARSDSFASTAPLRPTGLRPEYFPGGLARGTALPRSLGAGAVISVGCAVGLGRSGHEARIPPDEIDYRPGVRGPPGPGARHPCGEQLDFTDDESVGRDAKRPRTVHGDVVDPFFPSINEGGRRYSGLESNDLGLDSGRERYGLSLSRNLGTEDEYSQVPGFPRALLRSLPFERYRNGGWVEGHVESAASLGDPPAIGFPGAGKRGISGSVGALLGVNEGLRWHGTIAKGGTPVCRARCLPVGKSIDVIIPDVVNCTARTDLDMLAKHVHRAGDFGVFFFVPEADPDVPPYHDFMHYLGEKHRAGVSKLIDGTTLFLVPPSEFSEKVLKVPGNNCLFGVVLKAQQPSSIDHAHLQQFQPRAPAAQHLHLPSQLVHPPLQYTVSQQQQTSSPQGFLFVNGHSTRDNSALSAPPPHKVSSPVPTAASSSLTQSQLASLAGGLPTVLTPEVIASLTALLPSHPSARPGPSRLSGTSTQPNSLREGIGLGGFVGRIAPNSGSAIPVPAAVDNSSLHRPSQSHQLAVLQSQSCPSALSGQQVYVSGHGQQVGISGHISVPSERGSGYAPPPPKQSQVSPSVATAQPHPGPSPSLTQHAYLAAPSQGFQGPGHLDQQAGQRHRAPQHLMQSGGAPWLPSEQLAQLTALFTRRQEQPAQQQQAAELLQQLYQQQQSPLTPLPQQHQQPVPLPLPQSQARSYVQKSHRQQQLYAPHASTQQQWVHSGPLPQHLSQPLAQFSVVGSGLDGATATEVQQQQQRPAPPPTILQPQVSLPQQHVQQLLPTCTIGDQAGGASQDDTERQKRFQATLQLAAALLQQMQHPQNPGQGNPEQR